MAGLAPTPPERLVDSAGRPYFLWDVSLTVDELRLLLTDPDPDVRAYWTGKLLRQAKPDDVFQFVTRRDIESLWPRLERYLGTSKPFWEWILESWKEKAPVVVDLVAELGQTIEPPELHEILGTPIRVDTRHEILVNKLCAILGRSEIRDLQDVERLLDTGGDLARACADCPRKDAGFSPLTLSWVLRDWPVTKLAVGAGIDLEDSKRLERFRDELTKRLLTIARPGATGP